MDEKKTVRTDYLDFETDGKHTILKYNGNWPFSAPHPVTMYRSEKYTDIGDYCFAGMLVSEISFADGFRSIGKKAFEDSESLTRVSLPEHLEEIGEEAFAGLPNLRSIEIPGSVRKIGKRAFADSGLEEIIFREGVAEIGVDALHGCNRLHNVSFPQSLRIIEAGAFTGCTSLREIKLNNGLSRIGTRAFANTGLTFLQIPDSVTVLENEFCMHCENLERVILPPAKIIPCKAFAFCGKLSNVCLSLGTEILEDQAFHECPGFTLVGSIAIPPTVKKMSLAFSNNDVDDFNIYAEASSYAYAVSEQMGVRRYRIHWGPGIREWSFDSDD